MKELEATKIKSLRTAKEEKKGAKAKRRFKLRHSKSSSIVSQQQEVTLIPPPIVMEEPTQQFVIQEQLAPRKHHKGKAPMQEVEKLARIASCHP